MKIEKVTYRPAAERDIEPITEIYIENIGKQPQYIAGVEIAMGIALSTDTLSSRASEIFRSYMEDNLNDHDAHVIVAQSDRQIIGFLVVMIGDYGGGPSGMIYELIVREEFQGQGIGKSLLSRCIEHLRVNEVRNCLCSTGWNNEFAHEFLRRNGFAPATKSFHLIINDPSEIQFPADITEV